MGFHDDLARVAAEPEMHRLATRRAGSRELAEDALQETVRAITERKSSEVIVNLRGFFYVSLIREIDHQLGRPVAIPAENIDMLGSRPRRYLPLSRLKAELLWRTRHTCASSPRPCCSGSVASVPAEV